MFTKSTIKRCLQVAALLLVTTSVFAQKSTHKVKQKEPVYVHNLFFWLPPTLDAKEVAEFTNFFEGLRKLPYQKNLQYGVPAASTARPVLDQSYTYAVSMEFKTLAELEAYGKLPEHLALVAKYKPFIAKMLVYDTIYTK
ncbi:Dabb family protein [Sphingobacterium sp. MYb382]|uniref:Dabb family protein n=1 Tax=Sphingobacterium sp. MYb382 TaxID=2745278 RepID=UPI0030AE0D0F